MNLAVLHMEKYIIIVVINFRRDIHCSWMKEQMSFVFYFEIIQ